MNIQTFRTLLTQTGAKTVLVLPFDPNTAWGPKERHHVHGKIGGVIYRGQVKLAGGHYLLPLGPAWLRDAHLNLDQDVEVNLDEEGPVLENMPADVAAALAAAPAARKTFEGLPTFYRKNFMRWIESAKRSETRQERIEEMIALLAAGKREK
jgi:hypothetical protein